MQQKGTMINVQVASPVVFTQMPFVLRGHMTQSIITQDKLNRIVPDV